jgi:hypothetical protein
MTSRPPETEAERDWRHRAKKSEREAKRYRAALVRLSDAVKESATELDRIFNYEAASVDRGQKVAKLVTRLELINDSIRFSELGIDFRTGKPAKG